MASPIDFRKLPSFESTSVDRCGKSIGSNLFWKLYAIENCYRIIIHSVLSIQLNPNWWDVAVDRYTKSKIHDKIEEYKNNPRWTTPGQHEVYYTTIFQLNEIVRANLIRFDNIIDDMDLWITKIEGIRHPRNIIAHMNFPSKYDRNKIGAIYKEIHILTEQLSSNPIINLEIP